MSPLCTHIRESVGTGPIPDCRNDPTLSSSCMFRGTAVFVPLVLIISLRLQASSYPDKSLGLTLRADTDLAPSHLEGAGGRRGGFKQTKPVKNRVRLARSAV